ncbi:MAG: hypothetical protein Q4F79_04455 [Eubacteriales bacterium]|nr:hypothetical protein [Eubacteriales bacterium]
MRIDLRDRNDLRDPQCAPVIGYCTHCGGEIYNGEAYYQPTEVNGMLHTYCGPRWFWEHYKDSYFDYDPGDCYA